MPDTPTLTPDTDLRQRIAVAARTVQLRLGPNAVAMVQRNEPIILNYGEAEAIADAVLAAVQPELADYRNRITWETTCGEHARLLDPCRAADERAEKAEAALDRVREVLSFAEQVAATSGPGPASAATAIADRLSAALTPPADQPDAHVYLSTACHHGEHAYCQSSTGLAGAKKAASCKFCGAPCRCPCHQAAE